MVGIGRHVPFARSLSSPAILLVILAGVGSVVCALLLTADTLPLAHISAPIFRHLLYTYDAPAAHVSLLLLLVAVTVSPFCSRVSAFAAACGRHPWRLATLTGVMLALGARFIYHAHPLSMDEYAVWFQSRIFASGSLTGQFPPEWLDRLVPPGFQNNFLAVSHASGRVASVYWPGFALVMAPFSLIGAEWLCNPVLAALSLVAIARTCRLIFPENDAVVGWAMLFTVASPAFVAMGISYYAMTGLLLTNLVFVWGFLQPTPRRLFLAGIVGSIALTFHNPVPHILFAAPWLVWFFCHRPSWRQVLALMAGYAPLTLLLGAGWVLLKAHMVTDLAGAPGIQLLPASHEGILAHIGSAFTLPAMWILLVRLACAIKLWIWAVPGLLVLAGLGYVRGRENISIQLLGASAVLTFIGYFFVPFDQGHGWGYRYFHPAWSVLPILAGVVFAGKFGNEDNGAFLTLRNVAGALILGSLLILVPWQMMNIEGFIGVQLAQVPKAPTDKRSIVFLSPHHGFYLMDLVQNDPFLRNRSIRMFGAGEREDGEFLHNARVEAVPLPASAVGQVWLIQ